MRMQEAIEFVPRSSFRGLRSFIGQSMLCVTAVLLLGTIAIPRAEAQFAASSGRIVKIYVNDGYTILHNFNGSDGASPYGALIQDPRPSYTGIYGTTYHGGGGSSATCYSGCGTVLNV